MIHVAKLFVSGLRLGQDRLTDDLAPAGHACWGSTQRPFPTPSRAMRRLAPSVAGA